MDQRRGSGAQFLSRLRCGVVLLAWLGCAVPGTPSGSKHSGGPGVRRAQDRAGIRFSQLVVRPTSPRARVYGGMIKLTPGAGERALIDRVSELGLTHDPALSAMARELARSAPDRANIPPALVDGLLAWLGLVQPPPGLLVVEIPDDHGECFNAPIERCPSAIAEMMAQLRTGDLGGAVFGAGLATLPSGTTRMLIATTIPTVELQPMKSAAALHAELTIHGRLLAGRKKPSVEVVDPRGRWHAIPVSTQANGAFAAKIECSTPRGAYQVEVLAEGTHGPEVVANFPWYCGVAPPQMVRVVVERLDAGATPAQIARANFEYLNQARRQRGLNDLVWDPDVERVAQSHSQDMAGQGFVGHRSPTTGDVVDRFRRARVVGTVIRENVARGYGARGIHDSLMNSPGHRVNMLAHDVTHVGIGVVIAEPETKHGPRPVFVTQNFRAKGTPVVSKARVLAQLRDNVDAVREQQGLSAINWDPQLDEIAEAHAVDHAKGRSAGAADLNARVFAAGYRAVTRHQVQTTDVRALVDLDVWRAPDAANLGVGLAAIGATSGYVLIVVSAQK